MTIKHYAFGNVGRDQSDNRSSRKLDLNALQGLRRKVDNEQSAVFLCEINEGDDNNEMAMVRDVFPNWHLYGVTTREPILLSPDQPKARARVYWVDNTAVERWSPRRSVLVVDLEDEPTSLIGLHPAAGANGQGDRPAHARPLLQKSWSKTITKRNILKHNLHDKGRNIVEMLDANAYNLNTLPHAPGEKTIFHDDTDWGRVWAAKGYRADFRRGAVVDFDIDSHDGHLMHGTFRKKS